jgi:hypothetical protein
MRKGFLRNYRTLSICNYLHTDLKIRTWHNHWLGAPVSLRFNYRPPGVPPRIGWKFTMANAKHLEFIKKTLKTGAILDRAWSKHQELQEQKSEKMKVQSVEDFLGN